MSENCASKGLAGAETGRSSTAALAAEIFFNAAKAEFVKLGEDVPHDWMEDSDDAARGRRTFTVGMEAVLDRIAYADVLTALCSVVAWYDCDDEPSPNLTTRLDIARAALAKAGA